LFREKWAFAGEPNVKAAMSGVGGIDLEPLESRLLLSATLSSKGSLVAQGTSGNDTIVIKRDPQRTSKILVTINGAGTKFDAPSVKRIEMYGLGGATV